MVKIPDCDGSDENGADVDTEAEVSTTDTISENTLLLLQMYQDLSGQNLAKNPLCPLNTQLLGTNYLHQ